ncbi:MAG: glycosyl hydrolase 115 family protein, partial [Clostridiales bacterium]|nr:glycosyl hydrolase 115 family protein [Clostridiales bacterium]
MAGYLEYFTGVNGVDPDYSAFKDFGIRCYFDNDSDELINYKGENGLVNLDVYRQMARSLKKMGYNAIDIHDQLGRAEFYLWDSYKKYWNYKGDIEHINKIIDIVHEEGLLVQIPMYLGWAFNPLNEQHECWFEHKQTWIDRWNDYMQGPLGKCDLFLLRPRSPIYDCIYRCDCEKCVQTGTGPIMTEVFAVIQEIILSYKPDAKLICDLYAEGYDLFKDKLFTVSDRWLLLYSDNGFGKFIYKDTYANSDYRKGVYLHSGFWLNHTVLDPYLTPLYESVKKAHALELTDYILVNGQSFKNFTLSLEAIMDMCYDINHYDKESFIIEWLSRTLGIDSPKTGNRIVQFIDNFEKFHINMKAKEAYLSPEDDVDRGFIANSIYALYPLIYHFNKKTDPNYEFVDEQFSVRKKNILWTYAQSEQLLAEGTKILDDVKNIESMIENESSRNAFNDQFTFGVELLTMQLKLITLLFRAIDGEVSKEEVIKYH